MKRKVPVEQLTKGMYVSELDRPWLDTPFLFQGFFIRSDDELAQLRANCEFVYIDTLKGADLPADRVAPAGPAPAVPPSTTAPGERRYPRQVSLEQEMKAAREVRTRARKFIDAVFEDVRQGRRPDLREVKEVISGLVDSIVRNPDAQMCLTLLKKRDEYTAQHSVNVCVLTLAFGRHLGLPPGELNLLGMGALLHDIGKLRTPLEILNKPARLTPEEFARMKEHPGHGREILEGIPGIPPQVIDIAFGHHERLQGHGYPRGLAGDDISTWSRIVAIVDVYDAITSDRPYHDGLSATEALTKMYGWRERDFDPALMEQFIQCIGIYPIGTLVELTSGEVGVVITVNPQLRLRPKVMLALNEKGEPYYPARIVDLALFVDREEGPYAISRVLEPGSHGIDAAEQIRQMRVG